MEWVVQIKNGVPKKLALNYKKKIKLCVYSVNF